MQQKACISLSFSTWCRSSHPDGHLYVHINLDPYHPGLKGYYERSYCCFLFHWKRIKKLVPEFNNEDNDCDYNCLASMHWNGQQLILAQCMISFIICSSNSKHRSFKWLLQGMGLCISRIDYSKKFWFAYNF